jgi:hypothetical protein
VAIKMLKKKIFYYFLFFLICILTYVSLNLSNIKNNAYSKFPNLELAKYLFKDNSLINNINNDYNVKFLPETEFVKLEFIKKKINFKEEYYNPPKDKSISYKTYGTFFIDQHNDTIIVTDFLGNIYTLDNDDNLLIKNKKMINTKNLKSNLNAKRVFDTIVIKDTLYISYITIVDECQKINVSFAEINSNNLNFQKLFKSDECEKNGAPGRMQFFTHNNKDGILLSTNAGTFDTPGNTAQDKLSLFGKILFIEIDSKKSNIYSYGHRVIQGLYAENNLILSTEHGPKAGDEINKILFNQNYGWPIASYGDKYTFNHNKKPYYKKNHESLGFIEPLFSFIPGIGISEIIKLKNNFSPHFQNRFVVSSLNGRSIFIVNFDQKLNRVITHEKIFLNERIRDIKYDSKNKSILLALEENGELGILLVD